MFSPDPICHGLISLINDLPNQQPQADTPAPVPGFRGADPGDRATASSPSHSAHPRQGHRWPPALRPARHDLADRHPKVGGMGSPSTSRADEWATRSISSTSTPTTLSPTDSGCSPNQPAAAGGQIDPAKINEFIQSQDQAFQKLSEFHGCSQQMAGVIPSLRFNSRRRGMVGKSPITADGEQLRRCERWRIRATVARRIGRGRCC